MRQNFNEPVLRPKVACIAMFVLAAFAFVPFSLFLLCFGLAWSYSQKESQQIVLTVVAGWVYIAGSIFAFSRTFSRKLLLLFGLILNAIGACVWLPFAFSAGDSALFLLLGLTLVGVWIFFIVKNSDAIPISNHRTQNEE